MRNIVDEIEARADRRAVALIEGGRALTFGDLLELTEAAAAALSVQPGQRIGLNCPNGTAHIVWSLAVLRRGGVLVPVAPELSPRERDEQARTTGLHAILSADGKSWHRETPERFSLNVDGLGEAVLQAGLGTDGPPDFDEATLSALNPALIRFSSGTTGRRKGVVLSHRTLFDRVTASNARLGIGPGDRVIWTLPMAHHFAVSIVLYLLHGATTVIENSHLGADVHRALVRNRGTVLYASPFHHSLLAGCAEAAPVPSLRLAVSTAAALPEATARQFREKLGIPLCQALGIIECGLPILNDAWPQEKPLAIGRPQPAYSVSLRNAGGKEVADGETGALFLKGPGFVDAYLSPWTPQGAILEDGWFRTGDEAHRDAGGCLFLAGRAHSAINVGGMKCFPEEIEACLAEHASVREARVMAMAHPLFGSVPAAEIVPVNAAAPPKSGELMMHCRERLSGYKVPLRYTMVDSLPRTANGKLLR